MHFLDAPQSPIENILRGNFLDPLNALANAKLLFKALAAREANLDEPIPDDRIMDVAVQIGLEGDEFDSALDYAADQGWFEDAEVSDSASWVSLTPAGVAAAKS